jgi:hypothetical protein
MYESTIHSKTTRLTERTWLSHNGGSIAVAVPSDLNFLDLLQTAATEILWNFFRPENYWWQGDEVWSRLRSPHFSKGATRNSFSWISVAANAITSLPVGVFNMLNYRQSLYLHSNNLTYIAALLISATSHSLQVLDLLTNNISYVQVDMHDYWINAFAPGESMFLMTGNPSLCLVRIAVGQFFTLLNILVPFVRRTMNYARWCFVNAL